MSPFLFFLLLGAGLIATELLVFQFSIFWFLFVGIGALVAALVALVMPDASWLLITGVFLLSSVLISAGLYRPLSRWQLQPGPMAGNDAIGQTVTVLEDLTPGASGKVKWSGADWQAQLDINSKAVREGELAYITRMDGIRLTVSDAL